MPSRKSFDSTEIVAVLTKVVQEQEKQLKAQQKELTAVKDRLSILEMVLTNIAHKENMEKKKAVAIKQGLGCDAISFYTQHPFNLQCDKIIL